MQIREIINLMEKVEEGKRLDRSAFLYLESKDTQAQFAQCATCVLWLPESERCGLFSDRDEVVANASCGLYVQGHPNEDQPIMDIMRPEDAGYVLGQVRCQNCSWFVDGKCELFTRLNEQMPTVWDLDDVVSPKGCCNAWQGRS
jgi:hypothetical protein